MIFKLFSKLLHTLSFHNQVNNLFPIPNVTLNQFILIETWIKCIKTSRSMISIWFIHHGLSIFSCKITNCNAYLNLLAFLGFFSILFTWREYKINKNIIVLFLSIQISRQRSCHTCMTWFCIYVYSCILPKLVSNSSRQHSPSSWCIQISDAQLVEWVVEFFAWYRLCEYVC